VKKVLPTEVPVPVMPKEDEPSGMSLADGLAGAAAVFAVGGALFAGGSGLINIFEQQRLRREQEERQRWLLWCLLFGVGVFALFAAWRMACSATVLNVYVG